MDASRLKQIPLFQDVPDDELSQIATFAQEVTVEQGRELVREGIPVTHILADGSLETHQQLLQRLVQSLKLADTDLFNDPEELTERAYELQAARIAYVRKGT